VNRSCYLSHTCPQCGGEVVFDQEATGTRCKYCGAGLMVMGARSSWLNFLIKPKIPVRETGHAVTRIARKNGWKPTLLRSVLPFYFPFYRTTGQAMRWVRGMRSFGMENLSQEVEKLLTRHVDLTRPGHADLSPGLFAPGYRAQALHLHLATRENAGSTRFLPLQVEKGRHEEEVSGDFFDGLEERLARVTQRLDYRIGERHHVLFFPMSLVEIREGSNIRLLLLDTVGGGLIRQIDHEDMERLLDNMDLKEGRSPGENRLKLVPLICPECAGDLDADPMAHLRFCQRCARGWVEKKGRLEKKKCLWGGSEIQVRDGKTIFLPFWSRQNGERTSFIPAFGVQSPRLLHSLSSRYYQAGFTVEEIPYDFRLRLRTVPVQMAPGEADEMLQVVAETSEHSDFPLRGSRQSLVLIPFVRKGPDLVDQFRGLAVPVATLGGVI
jgi:DNA-directed RNA polymerase subunit RPC12/RpoP